MQIRGYGPILGILIPFSGDYTPIICCPPKRVKPKRAKLTNNTKCCQGNPLARHRLTEEGDDNREGEDAYADGERKVMLDRILVVGERGG